LEGLESAGEHAPNILKDLVIDPRNTVEHAYRRAEEAEARRAVQLAELFLRATDERPFANSAFFRRGRVVIIGLSIGYSINGIPTPTTIQVKSFRPDPILLFDVFGSEPVAKICDFSRGEMLMAPLGSFKPSIAIELARLCRPSNDHGISSSPPELFRSLKAVLKIP
jgi:hypothetical protein